MAITAVRRVAAFRALWNAVRGARRPGAPTVGTRFAALPRMILRTITGSYPLMSRGRVVLMGAALLYILSPVDLVPEGFLLVLGLGDDLMVLAWLTGAVLAETDTFLEWEERQRHVVVGEVVRG